MKVRMKKSFRLSILMYVKTVILTLLTSKELQAHGVNAGDIKKLKMAGIHTVTGVLSMQLTKYKQSLTF